MSIILTLVALGTAPIVRREPTSVVGGAYGKRERLRRAQFAGRKPPGPQEVVDALNYKLLCDEEAAAAREVRAGARLLKPQQRSVGASKPPLVLSLTYPQFLDAVGRVAMVAFSVPPHRNKYKSLKERIDGFVDDVLALHGEEWREKISRRPQGVERMAKTQTGDPVTAQQGFCLAPDAQAVLAQPAITRALKLLFNYYRKLIPLTTTFEETAARARVVDLPGVARFALDFRLVPAKLTRKHLTALYIAVLRHTGKLKPPEPAPVTRKPPLERQRASAPSLLGRPPSANSQVLGRALRSTLRSTGTADSGDPAADGSAADEVTGMDYDAWVEFFGRAAVEVAGVRAGVAPRAKYLAAADEPESQADMVWGLLRHLGLPKAASNGDVALWWRRACIVIGASAVGMGGPASTDKATAVAADGHRTTAPGLALRWGDPHFTFDGGTGPVDESDAEGMLLALFSPSRAGRGGGAGGRQSPPGSRSAHRHEGTPAQPGSAGKPKSTPVPLGAPPSIRVPKPLSRKYLPSPLSRVTPAADDASSKSGFVQGLRTAVAGATSLSVFDTDDLSGTLSTLTDNQGDDSSDTSGTPSELSLPVHDSEDVRTAVASRRPSPVDSMTDDMDRL